MTIASAFPFAIILLISMAGLVSSLRVENAKRESLLMNVSPAAPQSGAQDWQERLDNIIDFPNKVNVKNYLSNKVKPAMSSVVDYFEERGLEAKVEEKTNGIVLNVKHGDEHDFVYGVFLGKHMQPEFSLELEDEDDSNSTYYRAEVHLAEGGQDYDIMGWSKHGVLNDIVDQYHKHQHFLHMVR